MAKSKFPILDKYGVNLTALARRGKLAIVEDINEEILHWIIIILQGNRNLIMVSEDPDLPLRYLENLAISIANGGNSIKNDYFKSVFSKIQNHDIYQADLARIFSQDNAYEIMDLLIKEASNNKVFVLLKDFGSMFLSQGESSELYQQFKRAHNYYHGHYIGIISVNEYKYLYPNFINLLNAYLPGNGELWRYDLDEYWVSGKLNLNSI